jgi:hypothetical protein
MALAAGWVAIALAIGGVAAESGRSSSTGNTSAAEGR